MLRRVMWVCVLMVLVLSLAWAGQAPPGAEKFVGADTSLFISCRSLGRLGDDMANSNFWAKFRTLPGILMLRVQINQQLANNPQYQAFMEQHGEDLDFLKSLLRDEVTFVVPNASMADFAKLFGSVAEVAIFQGQLKDLGADADAKLRAGLQKQLADAWKRALTCKMPCMELLAKTGDPQAAAKLKRLFGFLKPGQGEQAPVVVEFASAEHAGVPIEKVSIGLTDATRASAVEKMKLADVLPADAAQDIGEALLKRLADRIEINYAVSGGYCMLCLGGEQKQLTSLIDRQKSPPTDALVASPNFKPVLDLVNGDVVTVFFVDMTTWGKIYKDNVSPLLVPLLEVFDRIDPAGQMLGPVKKTINDLDQMFLAFPDAMKYGGGVTVREQGLYSRGFAKVDPEGCKRFNKLMRDARFGHVPAFEFQNKPPKFLKMVPAEALLFGIAENFDFEAQWASITRGFEDQRPNAANIPELAKFMKIFDKYNDFVKKNLIPKLDREVALVVGPGGPLDFAAVPAVPPDAAGMLKGAPVPSAAIAFEVKDGPGLLATMNDLVNMINADLTAEQIKFTVALLAAEDYKGVKLQKFVIDAGEGFQPCYAVIGDFFLVATSPVGLKKMIDTAGGAPSIETNPRYKEVADVYKPECITMGFADGVGGCDVLKKLAEFGFSVAEKQVQQPNAGQAQLGVAMMIASIKTTVLQGLDCLKVVRCQGGCGWVDGDMVRSASRLRVIDLPPVAPEPAAAPAKQ